MFKTILMNGVLATVQSFDGSANVLSLTLPTERGGGQLTAMIVDALQVQAKSNPCPATTQRGDQTDSSTPTASTTSTPDCPQPKSDPETQKGLEHTTATTGLTITPEPTPWTPPQKKNTNTSAVSVSGQWSQNFEFGCYFFYYKRESRVYPCKSGIVLMLLQSKVCVVGASLGSNHWEKE